MPRSKKQFQLEIKSIVTGNAGAYYCKERYRKGKQVNSYAPPPSPLRECTREIINLKMLLVGFSFVGLRKLISIMKRHLCHQSELKSGPKDRVCSYFLTVEICTLRCSINEL